MAILVLTYVITNCKENLSIVLCVAATEGADGVIYVKAVDLLVAENGSQHHTEQFDVMEREKDPQLVVRRGQMFCVSITLSRAYSAEKDAVSFIFTVHGENLDTWFVSCMFMGIGITHLRLAVDLYLHQDRYNGVRNPRRVLGLHS